MIYATPEEALAAARAWRPEWGPVEWFTQPNGEVTDSCIFCAGVGPYHAMDGHPRPNATWLEEHGYEVRG